MSAGLQDNNIGMHVSKRFGKVIPYHFSMRQADLAEVHVMYMHLSDISQMQVAALLAYV